MFGSIADNLRLINFTPHDSEEWNLEYNASASAERSNKREQISFQYKMQQTLLN